MPHSGAHGFGSHGSEPAEDLVGRQNLPVAQCCVAESHGTMCVRLQPEDERSAQTGLRQSDFVDRDGFIAQALQTAGRLDWHPKVFGPYITSDDLIFQFVSPKLIQGMLVRSAAKMASWKDTDAAVAQHFDIMSKYGGPAPSNFTIYSQILGELAVEIFSRSCDNLTREGVMEAVESIKDWHSELALDGVDISFSPTDHVAFQSGRFLEAKVDANGKGYWEYFGPTTHFQGIQ